MQEEEDDDNSLTDDGANYLAIVFTSGLVQIWLYDSRILWQMRKRKILCCPAFVRSPVAETGSRATCLASCFAPARSKAAMAAAVKGDFGKIVSGGRKENLGVASRTHLPRPRRERPRGSGWKKMRVCKLQARSLAGNYYTTIRAQKEQENKKKNKKDGRVPVAEMKAARRGRNKNWKRDRELQWEKEEDERLHRRTFSSRQKRGGGKKGRKGRR